MLDVGDHNICLKHGLNGGAFSLNSAYGKSGHLEHLNVDIAIAHTDRALCSD